MTLTPTSPLSGLELPPIYCPLESRVNPALPQVERWAAAWLAELRLCADRRELARVLGTHSADFYARFAPDAEADGLFTAALWVYWGFAFDDACCDRGRLSTRPAEFVPLAARLQRALELPGADDGADDRHTRALRDIAGRFPRLVGPVQIQRFTAAHRAWLSGVSWQIANQACSQSPGLDDYLTMRLHSAGGEPTFALLEIANGWDVPGTELDSPAVRALTEMAILVAALDNDRHSFHKELAGGQSDQNIYTVLRGEQPGLTLADAVHQANSLRDRVFCRFRALRERVRPRLGRSGRGYLDGLAYGIRGNAEWGLRVPRYLRVGAPLTGSEGLEDTEIVWADGPADPDPAPPRLPTIAWWWDRALEP